MALVIISSLIVPPAYSQEAEDSQVFIAGFNAYQQKDYASSIEKMSEVLQKYPDTPLRDMALFWLSRSYFRTGNQQEAARYLSQFLKEYPDNPLKTTVEDELLALTTRYEKGEKLPVGTSPVRPPDRLAAQKARAEKERIAAAKAEEARLAAVAAATAETARIAALKKAEEAELARIKAAKAEQERIAAAKAEETRLAAVAAATAETARVAAVKQAEEKAAAEKKETERLAAVKAEEARLAAVAAATAETARIAALKKAEEAELARVKAAKAEQERIAAVKAEETRLAAVAAANAETARVAAIKQAEEKAAAEKKETERLAAVKAEEARLAAVAAATAETARIAALKKAEEAELARVKAAKAEQERIAAAKAEETRLAAIAAANAETARVAAIKQAEEKAAAEKKETERLAAVKAEETRIAAIKAEEARLAAVAAANAETARIAAIKQAEEKAAAEKKETERLAAVKAEETRIAAVKAEEARLAAIAAANAETARIAALKQAEEAKAAARKERDELQQLNRERIAAVKAEETRLATIAATNAETARVAAIKQAEEKAAAEKKEQERIAAVKAALRAEATAEAARIAVQKAESDRAVAKVEKARLSQEKRAEEKALSAKLAYREKAIDQYKIIIDKYPGSAAAVTAAAKLRELGIVVALPPQVVEAPLPKNAQVLRLEVAQFAGFEFNLLTRPDAFTVGRKISVPFEVINRGNGNDSFYLESMFPADFEARFTAAATPGVAISQTPLLTPGETFKGVINLVIPPGSIDGLRITHPVKAASRLIAEASQSREVKLIASAPLLRAVLRTDKTKPLPGNKVVYRIAILNVGSTVAKDVTFRLNFPPQFEPVDYAAAGFRQEMKSALVFDGLQINSGESREFSVTFQLKDDSLAGQELSTRAELINNSLKTNAAFVSNVTYVEAQRSIFVGTGSDRLVAIPGQTLSVPFVVTNTGNVREKFKITSIVTGARDAVIFNDMNRDGIRQASEPVISEIGPLAPREEASVVVEIKTPNNAADGSQGSVQVSFVSEGNAAISASGSTQLTYSRPVLTMVMAGRDGRLKPGDVASFDLAITNNGSNLARIVELRSTWPEQLELVAADPAVSDVNSGTVVWRFKELGAGEKRSIKVSFRVKPGTGVGTAIQVINVLAYEDQLGNRY